MCYLQSISDFHISHTFNQLSNLCSSYNSFFFMAYFLLIAVLPTDNVMTFSSFLEAVSSNSEMERALKRFSTDSTGIVVNTAINSTFNIYQHFCSQQQSLDATGVPLLYALICCKSELNWFLSELRRFLDVNWIL